MYQEQVKEKYITIKNVDENISIRPLSLGWRVASFAHIPHLFISITTIFNLISIKHLFS